jgi:hypothetical protein
MSCYIIQLIEPPGPWNKIEVLTRGQSNNKEWFNQRADKLLITKLVSIPNILWLSRRRKNGEDLANVRKKETLSNRGWSGIFVQKHFEHVINSTKGENI